MIYTEQKLRIDLSSLGVNQWQWAGDEPKQVRPEVKAKTPGVTAGSFAEIAAYCWQAYQKSFRSSGDLIIGRVPDLERAGLYAKVGEILEKSTLFSEGAQGNLLKMDKWALSMNDSWILGGVHRQAKFRLASPRILDNLWNSSNYFVVTAREVLGLLTFGYEFKQIGPWQVLVCCHTVRAMSADLIKYDAVIKKSQSLEQARKLVDAEGSSARAAQQVNAFWKR